MKPGLGLVAGLALALASVSSGNAQVFGPSVSIAIVEPKAQSNWGYAPASRKIAPGTWVTWSNDGQDAHTVTADDGSFDSGNLDPSEGFSWYFDQPGTWQYTCTLHTWMVGTIIVGDGTAAPADTNSDSDSGSESGSDAQP
jgi:plastocyanin